MKSLQPCQRTISKGDKTLLFATLEAKVKFNLTKGKLKIVIIEEFSSDIF